MMLVVPSFVKQPAATHRAGPRYATQMKGAAAVPTEPDGLVTTAVDELAMNLRSRRERSSEKSAVLFDRRAASLGVLSDGGTCGL